MKKKFRILCVDDSRAVRAYMKDCVNEVAETFEVATNGQEAIERLKVNADFDIIFMDWEMPVKDGATSVKEIVHSGIQIPIVMVTTKNDPKDIEVMLDSGAVDYVMKPFTADIILDKINNILGSV